MSSFIHKLPDAEARASKQVFDAQLVRSDHTIAANGRAHLLIGHRAGTFWPLASLRDQFDPANVSAVNVGAGLVVRISDLKRCAIDSEHFHFHFSTLR